MTKTCVYDNPATMAREYYEDGKLLCAYTANLLLAKEMQQIGATDVLGAGDWKPGQKIGDPAALPANDKVSGGGTPSA